MKAVAQEQSTYTKEQQAALKEAEELNKQVVKLYYEAKYSTAIPLAERALAIREKILGNVHKDVATSLHNLALLYKSQGNYQQAEPLYKRALAISEKLFGKEHLEITPGLNNLASLYREQGKYQQAEPLYKRALAIREKVLGNLHLDVAISLNNLAGLYLDVGNFTQAESLYKRALSIKQKLLKKDDQSIAYSLNNLAELYRKLGDYQQAEPLYVSALAIFEKSLGKEHINVATTLNNLATLYQIQGNYQQAEILFQRALAIREKILGKSHPDVAASLSKLGNLYQEKGNYQQAEPLLQRALAMRQNILGTEHLDFAHSLNDLAILYENRGQYQQAEPLLQRSLAITEKIIGTENLDFATGLNNLAELYRLQGNYQQAEPLYLRALPILEKIFGKEHYLVARCLQNLVVLYQAQGNISQTINFLQRALEVEERNLNLIFAVGSEQRKQNYIHKFSGTNDNIVSLSVVEGRNHQVLSNLALTTVLRRKGLVLDAMADSIQILRSQVENNRENKKLFNQWLEIQQQQSNLVFSEQRNQNAATANHQLEQLEAEKEKLEAVISAKSAEFRVQTQPVDLTTVQAKIPKDAVLVEIVQYNPFNAQAKTEEQKWGKARYAAAVLHSQGQPKWLDLGEAAAINQLANQFRAALATGKPVKKLARTLDQQVMAPIRPLLGNARQILIAPDGQLTLIPFEALTDEQNQFLIQRYAFSYLTTGRDLLRFQSGKNSASSPVLLADIDYENQKQPITVAAKPNDVRGSQNLRSPELANLVFNYLSATKDEAVAIKAILPDTQMLLGKDATETAVKHLHSPRILHLATHGFFIADAAQELKQQRSPKMLQVENPLLRSGLALAGANQRNRVPADRDDGILTALEVAGLDLRSTDLVVLSACETGSGDVKVGNGVYGLRRALVIAGSQTQVLSLWLVDDEATKLLMVKYYQNLKAGQGRHEALRSAQLELLNSPDYQHPKYWAAFVPSGNWTVLSDK
ncbi:CHAT domain-containing protein [Tolypothrix sp. PCC 7910]|nr:CHAT domain-containing protein [Tolypothrix sp. PCC 7910]